MDLSSVKLKPNEGMLAVYFVGNENEEDEQAPASYSDAPTPIKRKALIATVHSVGPKCEYKPGDLILTNQWACEGGTKIDENGLTLISGYDVLAKIVTNK